MDNLLYFKAIYNISDDQFTKMLEMVDGFLGISSLYKKPYRKLSFGERVKCEIASVILHNPAYLIFDEPTIGLDYKAKLGFYNMIKFLNKEYKTTILLITHEIDHIQDTCNRIIMMSEGNIKYDGSMAKIMEGRKIGCSLTVNYIEQMDELLFETLKKEAQTVDENKHIMKFICSGEEERQNVVERVVKGLKFSEIKTEISSFKEVFADVLQKDA